MIAPRSDPRSARVALRASVTRVSRMCSPTAQPVSLREQQSITVAATVIDCCSRKLAGWAVGEHIRDTLVTDALKATLADRGSLRGAIIHADHGAQYTSKDYAKLCDQLGVTLSLGG